MKKITGLVAILIVALLGGYYATGVLTEKTLKNNIAAINDPNGLAVNFSEYHRGWFKSTAILETKLHIPAHVVKGANGQAETTPEQNLRLPLPMTINHGPIIFSRKGIHFGYGYAHSVVQIPAEYQAQFDAMFTKESQKPHFDISILVNYLNHSTIKLGIPAFKATTIENNINFAWKGMLSSSKLSPGMDKLVGDFHIKGFHADKGTDLDVNMGTFDVDYNLKKVASGVFLGPTNLSFDSFTVKAKDNDLFQLSEFKIKSNNGIKDNLFYASINVELEKIEANKKVYGPGKLDISIKNLDSASLLKIHQQAMTMQQSDESQRQRQMMAMLPDLPALLSKGPELEIAKFEFTMPEGVIKSHLKFVIPQEENSNTLQMIQKIQGNGKISIPAPVLKMIMLQSVKQKIATQPNTQQVLVEQLQKDSPNPTQPAPVATPALAIDQQATTQVDSQIANLISSGVIVQDGNNYVLEFELKEGKLIVNGKPFNQAMMHY
jgi:uncharacterized protein YdgA (DUF945 family)